MVGGKETEKQGQNYSVKKKKAFCAVELTDDGKVKYFYVLEIDDFSIKSLNEMIEKHIIKEAKVASDELRGYRPINKEYQILQIPSLDGINFKAFNILV